MAQLIPGGGLPVAEGAAFSPELGRAVDRLLEPSVRYPGNGDADPGYVYLRPPPAPLSDGGRAEAQRRLDELERLASIPIDRPQLARWMLGLNAGFRNPLTEADFGNRVAAFAIAFFEWPAALFSEDTQRLVLVRCDFWPAAADVAAILEPLRACMMEKIVALTRSARCPEPPPPTAGAETEHVVSPERRAEIDEVMCRLHAGVGLNGERLYREQKIQPRYLTPDQLREAVRQANLRVPLPRS